MFGVVVLIEKGDGVKIVLVIVILINNIDAPLFFFERRLIAVDVAVSGIIIISVFGRRRSSSRVISTIGGKIECVEKSVG